MKKIIAILLCITPFSTLLAQELPKWADKARKAVFSIVTYTKDNQILNTGNGFYIDETGTAVSDYSLFKGAERAVIITADGKELPVKYMMGANDMYDVVKFKADFDKKAEALQPAPTAPAIGQTVYLLPYSTQKRIQRANRHGSESRHHRHPNLLLYTCHANYRKNGQLPHHERSRASSGHDAEKQRSGKQGKLRHRHPLPDRFKHQCPVCQRHDAQLNRHQKRIARRRIPGTGLPVYGFERVRTRTATWSY